MAKKYDITQWADFVRGQADPASAKDMAAQLEAGDAAALRLTATLNRVQDLARKEREVVIPEHALRRVLALGSLRRAPQQPSLLQTLCLALTFDSAAGPALAGTRDMQSAQRQLVFEQDDFSIDLSIEAGSRGSARVVGQALRAGEQVEPLTEIPVMVVRENQVVETLQTNEFGEFQTPSLDVGDLSLRFVIDDGLCLEVPLASEFFED